MRGKGGKFYDEDDLDDGWDDYDDEYEQDEEEGRPGPPQAAALQAAAGKGKAKAPAPAAAAGASALARALCDPPPLRPDGKLQRGAKKSSTAAAATAAKQQASYPIAPVAAAPAVATSSSGPAGRFAFDTPSPDDVARAAGPQFRPAVGVFLAPSKTPTYKAQQKALQEEQQQQLQQQQQQQQQQSVATTSNGAAAPAAAMASLNLGPSSSSGRAGGGSHGGSAAVQPAKRRKLSEYAMEPDLAREVAAAAAAEADGQGEHRPGLHLVVMGHVDAGKSTLMGRLLHDLGHVSQKEAHKNLKEATQAGKASFSWAWVLDERPEERARGVTVDVAMARFVTPRFNVTLLDAPGHRDFVPNMIGGAAQADAALLVVDGSINGFEAGFAAPTDSSSYGSSQYGMYGGGAGSSGQTREHAQLARSLGVEQLGVVITKLDTCNFAQDRYEAIKAQLQPFLKTCGFRDASVRWLPAVGPSGENLIAPPTDPRLAAWWQGPTLVQAIDAFQPKARNIGIPLRLPIHDVFKGRVGGMWVGGKLEGGALRPGSKVLLVPSGELGSIKSVEVGGKAAPVARAGDSADVMLGGFDAAALQPGAVLCHPDFPVPLVHRFEARVLVLDVPVPVLKGQQVTIHAHTAREAGTITALVSTINPKTGEASKSKPRCLLKNQTAVVEVTPQRSMCLEEYADCKGLGRVVLRDCGRTIAVGIVTKLLE